MAAVTICSDLGAQKDKVWQCFHCFPIYFPWSYEASVLPMNTQDWSPSECTGWISLQSKGLSRVFSNTTEGKVHLVWTPWWLSNKESACNGGNLGSVPGLRRSAGEGNGNPLQYSCLENPMDRGAWRATWDHKQSDTTEVTDHTRLHPLLYQLHMHLDKLAFKIKK